MLLKELQEKLADKFWPTIGWLAFLVVLVFTFDSCAQQNSQEEFVAKLPQISNQAELAKALQGQPALYAVLKAPLSGQAASDPLGLLANPQVAIYYQHEEYQAHEEYNSETDSYEDRFYSWDKVGQSWLHKSKQAYIYGKVPLDISPCQIRQWQAIRSLKELRADFKEADQKIDFANGNFFYPQRRGDYEDNERYAIFVVKQNTPVSFLAQVGQDQIKVCAIGKDGQLLFSAKDEPTIIVNGEKKDLAYEVNESNIGWLLGAWVALGFAVVMYKLMK